MRRWHRSQHHAQLDMYIAQAHQGRFRIVKRLGAIDPNEAEVVVRS